MTISEKTEIPEDLICGICKNLFTDAVMIPCCGSSFCDECVRTALLESEDNECPDCHDKGSSPGSLIPNRFLRNSVNSFKNETGYNKQRPPLRAKPILKAKPEEPLVEVFVEAPVPQKTVECEEKEKSKEKVKEKTKEKVKEKQTEEEVKKDVSKSPSDNGKGINLYIFKIKILCYHLSFKIITE